MKKILLLILSLVLLLTGCWDRQEIENRAYITAVGIDLYNEEEIDELSKYTITFEMPDTNSILQKGSNVKRNIFTEISYNYTKAYRESLARINKSIDDGHTEIFIIGEDVAKDSSLMKSLSDELERDVRLSRKVKLIIAKDRAEDIIKSEIELSSIIGRYIGDLLFEMKKIGLNQIYTFDNVLSLLKNDGNALIPTAVQYKGDISLKDSAVIKDYELVGFLDSEENRSIMILFGITNPLSATMLIEYNDFIIPVTIYDIKDSRKIKFENNKLFINYYITLNININGYLLDENIGLNNESDLIEIEKKVKEKVESDIKDIIYKFQKEYKVDLLKIETYLDKFKNKEYQEIKENYEEIFSNADIKVDIDVKIRSTGMKK